MWRSLVALITLVEVTSFGGHTASSVVGTTEAMFMGQGLLLRTGDGISRPRTARERADLANSPPYPTTMLQATTAPVIWYDPRWSAGSVVGSVLVGFLFKNHVHDYFKCGYAVDGNSNERLSRTNNRCVATTTNNTSYNSRQPVLPRAEALPGHRNRVLNMAAVANSEDGTLTADPFPFGVEMEAEILPPFGVFRVEDIMALSPRPSGRM